MRAPKLGHRSARRSHVPASALAKDPSERWQSADELAEAIEEVYAETVGYATGPGARSSQRARRRAAARHARRADESDCGCAAPTSTRSSAGSSARATCRSALVGGLVLARLGAAA